MLWQYFDYLYFTIEETGSDSSIDLARGMVQVQIFLIPNQTFFPGFPEPKERKFGLENCGSKFLARHLVLWNKMLFFQNSLQLILAIWLSLASE